MIKTDCKHITREVFFNLHQTLFQIQITNSIRAHVECQQLINICSFVSTLFIDHKHNIRIHQENCGWKQNYHEKRINEK